LNFLLLDLIHPLSYFTVNDGGIFLVPIPPCPSSPAICPHAFELSPCTGPFPMLSKDRIRRVHDRIRFSAVCDAYIRVDVNAELKTERIVCVNEATFGGL